MLVDRLEKATEPPYAAGSTHTGDLLVSSDPSVIEVDSAGTLIAHRNGTATIQARAGGATLQVTVLAAKALRITPAHLEIEPGTRQALEVTADDGVRVPPDSIRWQTSNPNIAVAMGSLVQAGRTQGTASLHAALGDASAEMTVVVRARPVGPTGARSR